MFFEVTSARYSGMRERLKKKKLPQLSFTLDQFRADILGVMGGKENGAIICRYCNMAFTIDQIAVDHARPLSRGGSTALDNLDYPCRPCNARKGSMDPKEFIALLAFLETIPLARIDVLSRLEKAVKLAAGTFATQGVINTLKKSGAWQDAQKQRRDAKKAKESGLGAF